MSTLHSILTSAFEVVLSPLSAYPLVTLLIVSTLSGVSMAVAFRYTSNQTALRKVVNRARAELLAIKLFGSDPWVTLNSLKELLKFSSLRLWHSLPPLLIMAVPVALLLMQLALRFERRPALPHEPMLVEAVLTEQAWPKHEQLVLEAPSSIRIEAGPHRDASTRMITWRIESSEVGRVDLDFKLDSEFYTGQLSVADNPAPLSTISSTMDPPLPLGVSVESIYLRYPHRTTPLLSYAIPWWLTFLLVAMLSALLARPLVKVQL